jgi:hypothetical protein
MRRPSPWGFGMRRLTSLLGLLLGVLAKLPLNLVKAFIGGCDSQYEEIPFPCSYQRMLRE